MRDEYEALRYNASMDYNIRLPYGYSGIVLPQNLHVKIEYLDGRTAMWFNGNRVEPIPVKCIGYIICGNIRDAFLISNNVVAHPSRIYVSKGVYEFRVVLPHIRIPNVIPSRRNENPFDTVYGIVGEAVLEGVLEVV